MNVNEYGVVCAFSTGFDMSAQTSLSILFWKPSNPWSEATDATPSLTKTAAVGAGALVTSLGTFADKKYATYTFVSGDVTEAGTWSARVVYGTASVRLRSDVGTFVIAA